MVAAPARKQKRKFKFKSGLERERFFRAIRDGKGHDAPNAIRELRRLDKQKAALLKRVPSIAWLDLAWNDGETFPPSWDHPRKAPLIEPPASAMRTCHKCGRETPPNCISARD